MRSRSQGWLSAWVLMIAVAAGLCQLQCCEGAQELQFGALHWEQTGDNTVLLRMEAAWTPLAHDGSDLVTCVQCSNPSAPTVGDTLRLLLPHERNRGGAPSGVWFGDESTTGRVNGTQENVTFTVVSTQDALLVTVAEVEHAYPPVLANSKRTRVFAPALRACCRHHPSYQNHVGYAVNIQARVVLPPALPPPPTPPPRSPFFAWLPSVTVPLGAPASMHVKALDLTRSPSPQRCDEPSNWTGCRLSYSLARGEEAGLNWSVPLPPPSPLPSLISLHPHTALLSVPAQVSASFAEGDVLSVVVSAASRPHPSTPAGPAPSSSLAFLLRFKARASGAPSGLEEEEEEEGARLWTRAPPDASTWPSLDFVCQSEGAYKLNASGPLRLAPLPRQANFSARGAPFLSFASHHLGPPVGFQGRLLWAPPCRDLGVQALCIVSCVAGADCSPPVCGRVHVRGTCLQGRNIFLPPTPGVLPPSSSTISVRVGQEVEVEVRGGGEAVGEEEGIVVGSMLGGGSDRALALEASPGLPNGAESLGEERVQGGSGEEVRMRVRWEPASGQEGLLFPLCFRLFSKAKPELCTPVVHCVHLLVERPQQHFASALSDHRILPPLPPVPATPAAFLGGSALNGSTVEHNGEVHIAAGCLVTIHVTVQRGPYNAHVEAEPSVGIPRGATLEFEESREAGEGVWQDTWRLQWRPSRDFLHRSYPACLLLRDELLAASPPPSTGPAILHPRQQVFCVWYRMALCRACAEGGETLAGVAQRWYGLDWLQLWGANPEVLNPERVGANQELRLGPLYAVKPGDTLARLARRFKLSLSSLRRFNPQVGSGELLYEGQLLCVPPTVCPTAPNPDHPDPDPRP